MNTVIRHPIKANQSCKLCSGHGIQITARRMHPVRIEEEPGHAYEGGVAYDTFRMMGISGPPIAFSLCSCVHLETTAPPLRPIP